MITISNKSKILSAVLTMWMVAAAMANDQADMLVLPVSEAPYVLITALQHLTKFGRQRL
jgi:hypothetical protein